MYTRGSALARSAHSSWVASLSGQCQSVAAHQLPGHLCNIQGEGACSLHADSTSKKCGQAWPMTGASSMHGNSSPAHQQWQPPSSRIIQRRSFHSNQPLWHEQTRGADPDKPSTGHPQDSSVDLVRRQLLRHALVEVKEHGWSSAALEAAARKMSLSPSITGILTRWGASRTVRCYGWSCLSG